MRPGPPPAVPAHRHRDLPQVCRTDPTEHASAAREIRYSDAAWLDPFPCPKRRQTLGTQKNQRLAPCPQKTNRTAVGLSRPSTFFKRMRRLMNLGRFRSVCVERRTGSFVSRSTKCHLSSCTHPSPACMTVENVDGRDVGAKQSFVACPGHDE